MNAKQAEYATAAERLTGETRAAIERMNTAFGRKVFHLEVFCKIGACASALLFLQASFVLAGWVKYPISLLWLAGMGGGLFLAVFMMEDLEAAVRKAADDLQVPVGDDEGVFMRYCQPSFLDMWGFRIMTGNSGGLIDRIGSELGDVYGKAALWAALVGFVIFCAAAACTGVFVIIWLAAKVLYWMGAVIEIHPALPLFTSGRDDSSIVLMLVASLLAAAPWFRIALMAHSIKKRFPGITAILQEPDHLQTGK